MRRVVAGRLVLLAGALFAVYGVWGSTYLAIAVALGSFPPLLLMAVRSLVAGAVLYGGARLAGAPAPAPAEWRNAGRVGVLFFVVGHGLLAWGETRVASGVAAVLIATEPLFIVLVGWLGWRWLPNATGRRPTPRTSVALLLGLAGVGLLALPGGAGAAVDFAGAGALVVASLSWAVGTFYARGGGSPARNAGMQLLVGGAVLSAVSLATGELARWSTLPVRGDALLALLYLVLFGSVITFSAYVWLLREIGAERLSSHTFVNPVIAVALGVLLGGEALGARLLLAAAVILAGVVLLLKRTDRVRRRLPRPVPARIRVSPAAPIRAQ